jgi:hypothetical protein
MTRWQRVRRVVLGAPRDVQEPHAFHKLSLVAFLAWVGLGADGLSSSAYGPEETFRQLGQHVGLAVFLAAAMIATVFIISYGYSRIIEQFPSGGGGYLVASKVLGGPRGVVAGSALLVDYVLTITISIAAGADAIFSFLPARWADVELPVSIAGIALLTLMNLRGIKESVTSIAPIFAVFLVTHAILLLVAIGAHVPAAPAVAAEVHANVGGRCRRWGVRDAEAADARVLAGRRHVHRHRGGVERRRHHARAARPDREADHAADGDVAGHHRVGPAGELPPLARAARSTARP